MTAQTTPPPVIEKIETYFNDEIPLIDFAQQLRRASYILATVMMQPDAEQNITNSCWASDCFYHLNDFAELIDPVLEKK
jgi:hypothetical protein